MKTAWLLLTLVMLQAPRLNSVDDRLDLKDLQIIDAKLDSIQSRAALLNMQLLQLQRDFDDLTKKRQEKMDTLFKRNNIDPSQWKISNIETGELTPVKEKP